MCLADKIKDELEESTKNAVKKRGSYCGDIRNFTRDRKLSMKKVICLLLGMTGGSLAKELNAAGVEATPRRVRSTAPQGVVKRVPRYFAGV